MEGFKIDQNLYRALNQLLQDLTVAERNIHILHWNLIAEGFIYLHPYLGDVYNQIFEYIDITAEQIRFQEALPEGTLQEANSHTRLNRVDSNRTYSSQEAITITISNLEYLKAFTNNIITYADENKYWDIVDVFTAQVVYYDKVLYFLRSSLEK